MAAAAAAALSFLEVAAAAAAAPSAAVDDDKEAVDPHSATLLAAVDEDTHSASAASVDDVEDPHSASWLHLAALAFDEVDVVVDVVVMVDVEDDDDEHENAGLCTTSASSINDSMMYLTPAWTALCRRTQLGIRSCPPHTSFSLCQFLANTPLMMFPN